MVRAVCSRAPHWRSLLTLAAHAACRVPEQLNVASTDFPDVVASEMHTALHETAHVLGGVGPFLSTDAGVSTSTFRTPTGAPADPATVWAVGTDAAYGKPATYIITPRVRNVTLATFGCASLPGFPIEDLQLVRGGSDCRAG